MHSDGSGHTLLAVNRLANEKSPYLLQHAHNPVDWHPWGDEAFALARDRNKPIFLSIGYSTCHWCHVMAHESFEDADVAALLNDAFICIKVDREERPDIDSLYMSVCQSMTGQGGWPLSLFITPEKTPFFAATYLPKESRNGRMGMLDLIPRVKEIWQSSRAEIDDSAGNIIEHLRVQSLEGKGRATSRPDSTSIQLAVDALSGRFDQKRGGFGEAPKFPSPHTLLLLMRNAHRAGANNAAKSVTIQQDMVAQTLRAMRMGGIFDHVGYGFHRYSTDSGWLLPHFEKMLYDQAMMSWAYVEGWQISRNHLFRRTAEEVFAYVMRDMTDAGGAFRSAEDADSRTDTGQSEEGWFYTFTLPEIQSLPADLADIAVRCFTARAQGNFADESTGRSNGRNILHLAHSEASLADMFGLPLEELQIRMEAARANLYMLREQRVRPHLDDKVLTDWNGLMISALARGARAFDAPQYAEAAVRAALFVLTTMRDEHGGLLHRYRDGDAAIAGLLDDYAFFIHGLIDLYQATFDPRWLSEALRLQQEQEDRFAAVTKDGPGGYYLTGIDGEVLPLRPMEAVDGAMPSGNSISLLNLLRLARLTGRPELDIRAESLARAFAAQIRHMPSAFCMFLCGVDFAESKGRNVVVTGYPDTPGTEAMLQAVNSAYAPDTTLLFRNAQQPEALAQVVPFTAYLTPKDGRPTAYLCENYTCSQPITDLDELKERMLRK